MPTFNPRQRYLTGLGYVPRRRRRALYGLGIHAPGRRYLALGDDVGASLGPYTPIDLSTQPYLPGNPESGPSWTEGPAYVGAVETAIQTQATMTPTYVQGPGGQTVAVSPGGQMIPFPQTGAQAAAKAAAPPSTNWWSQTNTLGFSNSTTALGVGAIALLALLTARRR